MNKELVVVTGGSGFIASHIMLQLLQQGYAVRATVRSLERAKRIETVLTDSGLNNCENLSFIEADLGSDKNWDTAVKDATYVIHVASPTPKLNFKNEDEMIRPAVDGVLRVLKAARDAAVKRCCSDIRIWCCLCGSQESHNTIYRRRLVGLIFKKYTSVPKVKNDGRASGLGVC